ncbi:LHFPL tetraspan subfamily member 6 protein-like [Tubulanus polymorphus]|uniref:LHFPL tetraspan subfamily member 6 protein-like n=1 Tax=Tubulanus polymorphus TaxID=672921 RepID=UPI003DA2AF23
MAIKLKVYTSRLNCGGVVWALISTVAAVAAGIGFYLPYWLEGKLRSSADDSIDAEISFGTFRRCNNYYHQSVDGEDGVISGCGRYTTFDAIPSLWWRVSTIVIGTGCGVALLMAFLTVFAICLMDVFSKSSARISGALQGCAGLLIGGGCALYPIGWDNAEVSSVCGNTVKPYNPGMCSIGWAFYLTAIGGALTFISCFLSCNAVRYKKFGNINYHGFT